MILSTRGIGESGTAAAAAAEDDDVDDDDDDEALLLLSLLIQEGREKDAMGKHEVEFRISEMGLIALLWILFLKSFENLRVGHERIGITVQYEKSHGHISLQTKRNNKGNDGREEGRE